MSLTNEEVAAENIFMKYAVLSTCLSDPDKFSFVLLFVCEKQLFQDPFTESISVAKTSPLVSI